VCWIYLEAHLNAMTKDYQRPKSKEAAQREAGGASGGGGGSSSNSAQAAAAIQPNSQ
jgi:hypothetical protein